MATGRLRAAGQMMLLAPLCTIIFVLPPVWIGFTVALAPVITRGMFLSAEAVGEPNHWLLRKKLPHSCLRFVAFHIPVGLFVTLYSIAMPLMMPAHLPLHLLHV